MPTALARPLIDRLHQDRIIIITGNQRLTLTPLRHGSDRYGPCEHCHQPADRLWYGEIERRICVDRPGKYLHGWTFHESPMPGVIAHRACLETEARRHGLAI